MSSPDRVERVVKAVDLLSSRKRPHVDLEYEGSSQSAREEPVRVKQEFASCSYSCQYGEYGQQPLPLPRHEVPPYLAHVKPESLPVGSSCDVTQAHSHTLTHHPPFHSSSLTLEPQYIRHSQSAPSSTISSHYESFNGAFEFPPWGLAAAAVTNTVSNGATFGSLIGADMSQSLEQGAGLQNEKKVTPTKGKSARRLSRLKRELEEDDGWEPPLWRQQLQNITKMREARDAPVDLMGAHKNAEQTTTVTPEVRRYQVLVSLMLSSQTKDQITAQAMKALKSHGLTIENILKTPEEDVAKLIHPVGFWRKKAGYIKRVSQILLDKYGGDIPATMDELCSLPGVGPKMSHLVMDIAWDNTSGIAVDTHVHRISHRLGWMRRETENPEVTRVCLEKWLPKSDWRELNWLLVGFGQQRCLPTTPRCRDCLNKDICPASKLEGGGPWGKKKKTIKKEC